MDQVLPLMGTGLMWFGLLLSPIFSVFMMRMVLLFDRKFKLAGDGLEVFTYSYMATIIGFVHYQNIQLIMLYFSCRILPLWIVYKLLIIFKLKESRRKCYKHEKKPVLFY